MNETCQTGNLMLSRLGVSGPAVVAAQGSREPPLNFTVPPPPHLLPSRSPGLLLLGQCCSALGDSGTHCAGLKLGSSLVSVRWVVSPWTLTVAFEINANVLRDSHSGVGTGLTRAEGIMDSLEFIESLGFMGVSLPVHLRGRL